MKYVLILFFLTPVSTLCQTNQLKQTASSLTISGEVSNLLTSPRYIYAIYADTEGGIDSSLVTNHKFEFSKKIATTTLLTLYATNPHDINNLREEDMLTIVDELDRPFHQALSLLYKKRSEQEALKNVDSAAYWKGEINKEAYKLATFYYQYLISNPNSNLKLFLISDYLRRLPVNVKEEDIDKIDTLFHLLLPADKKSILGKKVEKKNSFITIWGGRQSTQFYPK
ncbi:DUF4369 domain-containing protein [Niabella drilacis]|uniref:DUF4369 domain-containing protein n=1 Tax=Niabella drilacis (strain DSM 25811 / CCM 8410 / CCUG 62505 / LMG 26954 / E90) TaxID=1285928 RepID=A0A1G7AZ10_NIADE|nr:DUF4369 domain-containing protein [Niabella drilacis]SDE20001.1 protein of unknown function [Niabella drilacis]